MVNVVLDKLLIIFFITLKHASSIRVPLRSEYYEDNGSVTEKAETETGHTGTQFSLFSDEVAVVTEDDSDRPKNCCKIKVEGTSSLYARMNTSHSQFVTNRECNQTVINSLNCSNTGFNPKNTENSVLYNGATDRKEKKDRGLQFYATEMNTYVKSLFSKGAGFLESLKTPSDISVSVSAEEESSEIQKLNDSQDPIGPDIDIDQSQMSYVIRIEIGEPSQTTANSLLSKLSKGLNYTNSITKYIGSMPAVRSLTSTFTGAVSSVQDYFKLIKPGTQWCGDGDRAKSFEDLGLFYKTDACCREHDKCPEFILSGAEKYGLKNDGLFTKLHCDCDVKFYQCLKSVHTPIALSTGFEYFNILKPPCFKKEHPVTGCNGFNKGKCVQHRLNKNEEKIWQWFENKEFL